MKDQGTVRRGGPVPGRNGQRVIPTLLGLLVLAGGCVAPAPPPVPPAAVPPTTAAAGGTTIVAVAPPATPPQTLPQWLGVNDMVAGFGGLCRLKHQLFGTLFPGLTTSMAALQPPPPLKSLTDPANLSPDAPPGVKDIAQVKADEDAAPQKIAAIKYAASIGCVKGHPGIERAFLQFLDDPTEAVRYEAAKALAEMIGTPCETCPKGSCCTPAIYKKLMEIVTKERSPGCYVEYSDRVRRMARLAITNCGPPPPIPAKVGPAKIEGPPRVPLPKKEKIEGPIPPPPAPGITATEPKSQETKVDAKRGKPGSEVGGPVIASDDGKPGVVQTSHETGTGVDGVSAGPAARPALMVQWERVSVPFSNFTSHKDAFNAISYLRARVLGARLVRSPGFNKDQVSVQTFDWTDLDTVTPSVLARTLKSLPIGQVSPVLKDRQGYHLVRVLQRQYRHGAGGGSLAVKPHTPATPPAKSGPIQQTGGVDNAFPVQDGRREPNEQWPPDLGSQQLQPIRGTQPRQLPQETQQPPVATQRLPLEQRPYPVTTPQRPRETRQPEPPPQMPRSFPDVDENAFRPPLPKPDPERVKPAIDPEPKKPEPKEPKVAEPKFTEPTPVKPKQPIPQIFDTRTDTSGSKETPNKSAAFPNGHTAPPSQTDSNDFDGYEPFPADRKESTDAAPQQHVPSDIASPSNDGRKRAATVRERVRPEDVGAANPLPDGRGSSPTVAPAGNWAPTPTPKVGRYHLPKEDEPMPVIIPAPLPSPRQPEIRTPQTQQDDSTPRIRPAHPLEDDPALDRRSFDRFPHRRIERQSSDRPTSSGFTPTRSRFERPTSTIAEPQPQRTERRATDWTPPATPTNDSQEPAELPVSRENTQRGSAIQPASEPARLPAASSTTPAADEPELPQPRRRGNVYIETGRRSAVREISFDAPASSVRNPRAVRPIPTQIPVQHVKRKPKSKPKKPAVAKSRKPLSSRSASNTLPRRTDSIRFLSVDQLREQQRRAATADREASQPPERKSKPLYFSRSGGRDNESDSGKD